MLTHVAGRVPTFLTLALLVAVGPWAPATAGHLSCGDEVGPGHVVLDEDLACDKNNGTPALTVGADNTTIDLNGFTISCTSAAGYEGSCQDTFTTYGVRVAERSNVVIKGPGTITGFNTGVYIHPGFHDGSIPNIVSNITVRDLIVTGPAAFDSRPEARAIEVTAIRCSDPLDAVVKIRRNEVSYHLIGINLNGADCVHVTDNHVHDNKSEQSGPTIGINVEGSSNNWILRNLVEHNGVGVVGDGGIRVDDGASNSVSANNSSSNDGDGIVLGGAEIGGINPNQNNTISNNEARDNTFFDLAARNAGPGNVWKTNNRCLTQGGSGTGQIPVGVCNAGE